MKTALACIMGLCLAASVSAQELSTAEFPTEDEIFEAFATGEIDFEQYTQLLEILQNGIDSTELHLLDAIPNLSFFGQRLDAPQSTLQSEQEKPFVSGRKLRRGTARYGYYQRFEDPRASRYSLDIHTHLNRHWDFSLRVRKDLNGRERITGRDLRFTGSGALREARIGTFTRRLGLGTVFGYRGKLLRAGDHIDGESFAHPDFGGFNGTYGRFIFGKTTMVPLVSMQRDTSHRLFTAGGMIRSAFGRWEVSVILGLNRFANRQIGQGIADYKVALGLSRATKQNSFALEYCVQTGYRHNAGTFALEGTHKFGAATLQLAAWAYGDQYLNLTGGSKAASLRRTEYISDIDFSYSEKRAGQEGGLVKTSLYVWRHIKWSNSALLAARNRDTSSTQWLSELEYKPDSRWRFTASALAKQSDRSSAGSDERRVRGELAFRADNISMRSYVAHTAKHNRPDYLSWFVDCHVTIAQDTRLQWWSNLSRFARGSVEYWYTFLRTEHQLSNLLAIATKLMHRYDRIASQTSQFAFSLEVNAGI